MRQRDERATQAHATYTSTLPSDFSQTLRQPLSQSLARYYPPLDKIPLELSELLARLDKQEMELGRS